MTNSNSPYYQEQKIQQQTQRSAGGKDNSKFESGRESERDGLDPTMPHTFVNDSGDSNQIGRSEEEEIENNTDIDDMNKATEKRSNDLDVLSDNVNERLDRSLRISGDSGKDQPHE